MGLQLTLLLIRVWLSAVRGWCLPLLQELEAGLLLFLLLSHWSCSLPVGLPAASASLPSPPSS
jgi:hypothetical protein